MDLKTCLKNAINPADSRADLDGGSSRGLRSLMNRTLIKTVELIAIEAMTTSTLNWVFPKKDMYCGRLR